MRFSVTINDLTAEEAAIVCSHYYATGGGPAPAQPPGIPAAATAGAYPPPQASIHAGAYPPPQAPAPPAPTPNMAAAPVLTGPQLLAPMGEYGTRFGGAAAVQAVFARMGLPPNVMQLTPPQLQRMHWALSQGVPPDQINPATCPYPA